VSRLFIATELQGTRLRNDLYVSSGALNSTHSPSPIAAC